jgi:hypothetical protein
LDRLFCKGKNVASTKRNKSYRLSKIHDRRSRDLPRNAEVVAVEVDDPLALEAGEKIVALRSIRNDPLGRPHSHHQLDEAQFLAGRAFQHDWERAERGPQAVDPGREYVDGVQTPRGGHRKPAQGRVAAQSGRTRTRRRRFGLGA